MGADDPGFSVAQRARLREPEPDRMAADILAEPDVLRPKLLATSAME